MPDDSKKKALTPGLPLSPLPYQQEKWHRPYRQETWSQQYNAAYSSSYLMYYHPVYMSHGCCG